MIIESTHTSKNMRIKKFPHMHASAVFPLEMEMKILNLLLPVCLFTMSLASGGITRRGMRITDAGSDTKKSRK
jgi:hypothetical protein